MAKILSDAVGYATSARPESGPADKKIQHLPAILAESLPNTV
jgi:hypothetical protein